MLKTVFLSDAFYKAYPTHKYNEIEQKTDRPYVRIQVTINGVVWGIPLRSNISHPHVIWTDEENKCGVNEWKRNRLLHAGASMIIPDFADYEQLINYITK